MWSIYNKMAAQKASYMITTPIQNVHVDDNFNYEEWKPPVFDGFTPENITENIRKLEELLDHERRKYMYRVRNDNQFYIQKLQRSNYTFSSYYNNFTFDQIDKLIYFKQKDVSVRQPAGSSQHTSHTTEDQEAHTHQISML